MPGRTSDTTGLWCSGRTVELAMSEQAFDPVRWSFDPATGIGTIVLNRPDSLNSLSTQLRRDIVTSFKEFERLDTDADGVAVRCVVIERAGKRAFCAGADINEFQEVTPGVFERGEAFDRVEIFPVPRDREDRWIRSRWSAGARISV